MSFLLSGVGVNRTMPFCLLGCRGVILFSSISSSSVLRLLEKTLLRGRLFMSLWVDALHVTFLRFLWGDKLSFLFGIINSPTLPRLLGGVGTGMWRLRAVELWRRPCQLASFVVTLGTQRTLISVIIETFLGSFYCYDTDDCRCCIAT